MPIFTPFRGQVWYVNLDPTLGREQAGERPCLVLSVNAFNHGRSELVVVLPMTTVHKGIPSHVKVPAGEAGLPREGYIKCEEVRCISVGRLQRCVGSVTPATMADVEKWVRVILGR